MENLFLIVGLFEENPPKFAIRSKIYRIYIKI